MLAGFGAELCELRARGGGFEEGVVDETGEGGGEWVIGGGGRGEDFGGESGELGGPVAGGGGGGHGEFWGCGLGGLWDF